MEFNFGGNVQTARVIFLLSKPKRRHSRAETYYFDVIIFLIQGWLKKCSTNEANVLRKLFHKIYGDAHIFVQTKLQTKMPLLEAIYIRQCVDLLEGLNVGNSDPTSEYKIIHVNLFNLAIFSRPMFFVRKQINVNLFLKFKLHNLQKYCLNIISRNFSYFLSCGAWVLYWRSMRDSRYKNIL